MSEVYPLTWKKILLSELCSKVTDGTHHSPLNESEGDYLYVTAKNIKSWGLDISNMTFVSEDIHRQIYARCPVEYEDVLYIKDGVTTGLAAVNHLAEPFSMLSSVALLKPIRTVLDPYFLKNWLNSPVAFKLITDQMTGTAIKRVVLRQLRSVEIPLPPLNEQRRIVSTIEQLTDRSNKARTALADVPKLIAQFRQSVLAAAFRGDLTADWREKNPDIEPASELLERIRSDSFSQKKEPKLPNNEELDLIPESWTWVTVEHVGIKSEQTVLTGPFGANLGSEDFRTGGVPVITIGCLKERGLDMRKAMYIEQGKADELERYKLKSGDFLFSRMASVGRAAIVGDNLAGNIFNYHLMRLRLDEKWIEPKYFLYYVQGSTAVSEYVKKVNHGATRDGINTKQLSYMPVALPCLQEQRKIVECIETYWNVINEIEDILKKDFSELNLLDRSILAKAFRGELVPQDPNDEPAAVLLERIRAEREQTSSNKQRGKTTRKNSSKQLSIEGI